ncbi:hypothetical protein MMC07_003982 [Pseudocyphellaria aurata]|nr:hypothetical protein [Pseudocyphellaria aurata]
MTTSAPFGSPPATDDDLWIVKGLIRLFRIPPGKLDPAEGFHLGVHPPPNYKFQSRGPGLIVSAVIVIVLITLITGGRLALRWRRRDLRWGPDDWMIIPAAMGSILWMALTIPAVTRGGVGKHLWDVTYVEFFWYFKIAGIKQVVFYVTAGLIKISITLFNRRLTGLTSEKWLYAHNVFLVLVVSYTILALFINIFQCKPAGSQYDLIEFGRIVNPTKCLDEKILNNFFIICHVIFDFALLSVPLIVLYKIKMNTSRKIRIGFLFSIGSISCLGSAMRLATKVDHSQDRTWAYRKRLNWTIVDIFFGITAASLPVLNAAIPKRWRSPPDCMPLHDASPDLGRAPNRTSVKDGSSESIDDHGRYQENFDSKPNDNTLVTVDKESQPAPPVLQLLAEWADPAEINPTYRDRLRQSGGAGTDAV